MDLEENSVCNMYVVENGKNPSKSRNLASRAKMIPTGKHLRQFTPRNIFRFLLLIHLFAAILTFNTSMVLGLGLDSLEGSKTSEVETGIRLSSPPNEDRKNPDVYLSKFTKFLARPIVLSRS